MTTKRTSLNKLFKMCRSFEATTGYKCSVVPADSGSGKVLFHINMPDGSLIGLGEFTNKEAAAVIKAISNFVVYTRPPRALPYAAVKQASTLFLTP